MDGADVCRTSSRASRRPPDVISTAAILNPRWRRRKWRHPGPGARFSIPVVEGGGKWRPFRFRSPSWVTSFAGTGNEVTQDGDRKRKGRHFPPPSTMGIEKRALYYYHDPLELHACIIKSFSPKEFALESKLIRCCRNKSCNFPSFPLTVSFVACLLTPNINLHNFILIISHGRNSQISGQMIQLFFTQKWTPNLTAISHNGHYQHLK